MPLQMDMHLPEIENERIFECLCQDVLEIISEGKYYIYGRKGQKQNGIDIRSDRAIYEDSYVVCQCKNYFSKDNRLVEKVKEDIEKTDALSFGCGKFIVMTSLKRDNTLLDKILSINKISAKTGHKIDIEVLFWEDIAKVVKEHDSLLTRYYPNLYTGAYSANRDNALIRKKTIYQPLVDELSVIEKGGFRLQDCVETNVLNEIVEHSYKYGLAQHICESLGCLLTLIKRYNTISLVNESRNIIIEIFEKSYLDLYGSIYDGYTYCYVPEDDEVVELEIEAEPIRYLHTFIFEHEIANILDSPGANQYISTKKGIICCNSNVYKIFEEALHHTINGEHYSLPPQIIEIELLPEEYMVWKYDFEKELFNSEKYREKQRLKIDIMNSAANCAVLIREVILKIVQTYEVENI